VCHSRSAGSCQSLRDGVASLGSLRTEMPHVVTELRGLATCKPKDGTAPTRTRRGLRTDMLLEAYFAA
jgi:hypothetical protein